MKRTVGPPPILETVPQSARESFHCEVVKGRGYGARWHFHPEYQITLVLQSRGYRVVGDNIAPLAAGDLVLVGAHLPHVWHQDDENGGSPDAVHAIVVRFREDFLGAEFLKTPECEPVRVVLQRAGRGLQVLGKTQERVAGLMAELAQSSGFRRLVTLLRVLEELAQSTELKAVASANYAPDLHGADQERTQRVMRLIHERFEGGIERDEVARCAGLSAGAFSRFFKTRTGRTLPQYVNELRVGQACSLLGDARAKIADIALDCGFDNLAHFNRQFRAITGMAPRDYRERFREADAG